MSGVTTSSLSPSLTFLSLTQTKTKLNLPSFCLEVSNIGGKGGEGEKKERDVPEARESYTSLPFSSFLKRQRDIVREV